MYQISRQYRRCDVCQDYAESRLHVLTPHIAERRARTGETAVAILDRFMSGVHHRHLSGLPLFGGESA